MTAVVASSIAIATVVITFIGWFHHGLYQRLVFRPYDVSHHPRQNLHTMLTSGFLHADGAHLLVNLVGFLAFGFELERTLGSMALSVIYVVGLVMSDLFTLIKRRHDVGYNTLGASAAVIAVIVSSLFHSPLVGLVKMILLLNAYIVIEIGHSLYVTHILKESHVAHARAHRINHDAHWVGGVTGLILTLALHRWCSSEHPTH